MGSAVREEKVLFAKSEKTQLRNIAVLSTALRYITSSVLSDNKCAGRPFHWLSSPSVPYHLCLPIQQIL